MTRQDQDGSGALFPIGDEQWRAVVRRDRRSDGLFVTGVTSTGIYCRPSCPARRPRRDRVRVFPDPAAAERAGFRACRRCRPREASRPGHDVERMVRVCRLIESDPLEAHTLASLGERIGMSGPHLQRVFRRVVGVSPRRYAAAHRVIRLKRLLRKGDNVTRALYEAGFGSSRALYASSGRTLGMTPGALKKGAEGMRIGYTVVDSGVGRLLVAATARGICAVSMGGSDAPLLEALRGDYPGASIEKDREGLAAWGRAVSELADGRDAGMALPLDVRGTAFQARVWAALQAIPFGRTMTYGEIARAIGSPGAARAVGRACATNKAAVVIPCHRAIGAGGNLTGYRWGTRRKRRILAAEAAAGAPRGSSKGGGTRAKPPLARGS